METRVAPLTISPGYPLAKFLLLVPVTLCFAGLEVLFPKKGMLAPGDITVIPMHWKLRLSPSNCWATHASESTGKERSFCAGWDD